MRASWHTRAACSGCAVRSGCGGAAGRRAAAAAAWQQVLPGACCPFPVLSTACLLAWPGPALGCCSCWLHGNRGRGNFTRPVGWEGSRALCPPSHMPNWPKPPTCSVCVSLARHQQVKGPPCQLAQVRGKPCCWDGRMGLDLFGGGRAGLHLGCAHFCARCQPQRRQAGAGGRTLLPAACPVRLSPPPVSYSFPLYFVRRGTLARCCTSARTGRKRAKGFAPFSLLSRSAAKTAVLVFRRTFH